LPKEGEKMKKVLKISLVMVVLWIAMIGNVYGITLTPSFSKVQVEKGKEFDVDFSIENVRLSDVQSDTGIVTMTATLDYDKDNLELIKLEGQNGWSTPRKGSFNEENGKIVITNDDIKNGVVLRLRFKLNDNASKNPEISLNNITFADGDVNAMLKLASEKTVVTIKETNNEESGTQTGTGNQGGNGSQNGSGTQTGTENQGGNGNQNGSGTQTGTGNQGGNGNQNGNGTQTGTENQGGNGNQNGNGTQTGTENQGGNGSQNGSGTQTGTENQGGNGSQNGSGTQTGTGNQGGNGSQNGNGTQTGTDNQGSNSDKTTITNKELPKTGEPSYVGVIVSGIIILVIAVFSLIKINS